MFGQEIITIGPSRPLLCDGNVMLHRTTYRLAHWPRPTRAQVFGQ